MAEIIDLTASPQPEVIEISSEGNTSPRHHSRTRENKKRKKKGGKTLNGLSSDGINSSAQFSRAHSPEIGNESNELNESTFHPKSVSNTRQISPSIADEPGLFFFDGTGAHIAGDDSPPSLEPVESNEDGNKLLLPSHVLVFRDSEPTPSQVIPPPKPSSDDEEYIEYLDYEDRKAPGLIRYFEAEGDESSQPRPSIFKCKKCGAEGDHKTSECSVQICLTCGARDEHSTRSCPISKKCFACGMKGHISNTCPNRLSAHAMESDFHSDCGRCGSTKHNTNECPTLWRIYQYVNDEERILIMQSREQKKRLAIGEGGEGYIGEEMWCYNCAGTGHLGDDCNELPHPATLPTEYSAFSSHNIISGPFYDPAIKPVSVAREQRGREGALDRPHLPDDWNAGVVVDVGKRGKNKDKEKLEKRFREQEDEGEDWFDDMRNVKKRGMDQRAPPPATRGRERLRFGLFKNGTHERSSPPPSLPGTSSGGLSLLARLGDAPGGGNRGKVDHGRDRHEPAPHQFENSIRIRGAAANQRNREGRHEKSHKADWERGQEKDQRNRDKTGGHGGSGRGHGPRYRGGYGANR